MPIHPHECATCGAFDVVTFSVRQAIDPKCPGCGKAGERRFGIPHVRTNTTFLAGAKFGGEQFDDPVVRDDYLRPAREAGVSTNGKIYVHGLAEYVGDPRAWIDDKDDVKKIVEQKGWGCDALGVKPRIDGPPERQAIGEDLVDGHLDQMVKAGQLDPHDKEKVRDDVREKITPDWKRKDLKDRPVKRNPKKKKVG